MQVRVFVIDVDVMLNLLYAWFSTNSACTGDTKYSFHIKIMNWYLVT